MKLFFTIIYTLLFSSNAFAQWINIGPGGESLSSVSFADANNGWICGANSIFYQTKDGGKTWISIPNFYNFKPHNNMLAVAATASDMVVFIQQLPSVATPSVIYHSQTNSFGVYGYSAGSDALGDYNTLTLRQLSTGIAVGNAGTLALTRDKGFTWTSSTSGTSNDLFAADSPDGTVAYVAGSKGTLRKSVGPSFTSWQALNTTTTARLTGVWFVTPQQGYLVGDGGTAMRTVDGGITWTPMSVGTGADLNAVRFLNATTGFIVGDLGTLLLTTDSGKTWKTEASNTYETLTGIHATTDGAAIWVVGGGGTVLKRGFVALATRHTLSEAAHYQGYPNPFTTTISLDLPQSTNPIVVRLLDPLGRTVLKKDITTTASAICQIDVPAGLSGGWYILQVMVKGQPTENQRLLRLP